MQRIGIVERRPATPCEMPSEDSILGSSGPIPTICGRRTRPTRKSGSSRDTLREERRGAEGFERLVGRPPVEALRRVEHLRQEPDVAHGVEEHLRIAEYPVHCEIDLALLRQRLVPGSCRLLAAVPAA